MSTAKAGRTNHPKASFMRSGWELVTEITALELGRSFQSGDSFKKALAFSINR
jgi:hypothetical protein